VHVFTKASSYFWNLHKKTDFLKSDMTLLRKKFPTLFSDSWPFGITKPHFSAWKIDLKVLKNHILCSFGFLIMILPRFLGDRKKSKILTVVTVQYSTDINSILYIYLQQKNCVHYGIFILKYDERSTEKTKVWFMLKPLPFVILSLPTRTAQNFLGKFKKYFSE
jgi:hypothetical protein